MPCSEAALYTVDTDNNNDFSICQDLRHCAIVFSTLPDVSFSPYRAYASFNGDCISGDVAQTLAASINLIGLSTPVTLRYEAREGVPPLFSFHAQQYLDLGPARNNAIASQKSRSLMDWSEDDGRLLQHECISA
jgi:hypothetical protein